MWRLRRFLLRLHNFLRPEPAERELTREVASHLSLLEDEFQRRGMTPEQARLAARRAFGGVEQAKERSRDERSLLWLEDARRDVRHAARTLARAPGFTAVAVLTLALGIGATTAMFSIVNAVLVRPLPVENPDQLYLVTKSTPSGTVAGISLAELDDWRTQNRSFTALAGQGWYDFNIRGTEPESILVSWVSEGYLDLLGVAPAIGRGFLADEFQPGANRVALLGYPFWHRRFNGDPNVIGTTIELEGPYYLDDSNGRYTVIGVLPPSYWDFYTREAQTVVLPSRASAAQRANRNRTGIQRVVGRLTEGTPDGAAAEMTALVRRLDAAHHPDTVDASIDVTKIQDAHFAQIQPSLRLLMGATGLVALIASSNVALLLLMRGHRRRREWRLRASLGASRSRLVRQQLTESLVLAIMGGTCGVILSVATIRSISLLIPSPMLVLIPGGAEAFRFDATVLGAALGVSLLAGILAASAPAWFVALHAGRTALRADTPRDGGGLIRRGRLSLLGMLAVVQVMLAFALLGGAGLLLKSLVQLQAVNLGVTPRPGLVAWVNLNLSRYPDDAARIQFYEQVLQRLDQRPEVQAVSGIDQPFILDWLYTRFAPEMNATDPFQQPRALDRAVTATYFERHGVPLLRGRAFTRLDTEGAPFVAIISDSLARQLWPTGNPVGARLRLGDQSPETVTIVGVVGDVLHDPRLAPQPTIYRPYRQHPPPWMYFTLESLGGSEDLWDAARAAVWTVDPNQPVDGPWSLAQWVAERTDEPRFVTVLAIVFAWLGLLLASVGLYGVLAYAGNQRAHEFAIRMALGATRSNVRWLASRQGWLLSAVGIVIGLVVCAGLMQLLESWLFGVTPYDAVILATVAALFSIIAGVASYLPARRATAVDPMAVLRAE